MSTLGQVLRGGRKRGCGDRVQVSSPIAITLLGAKFSLDLDDGLD